jgi:hypothetical protein
MLLVLGHVISGITQRVIRKFEPTVWLEIDKLKEEPTLGVYSNILSLYAPDSQFGALSGLVLQ